MRKVIYGGACSLDGYLAGTNGEIDWLKHSKDVDEVMRKMVTHRVRRVLVVDGGGSLVGVISAADLLAREGRMAPELVEKVLEQISEPVLMGV